MVTFVGKSFRFWVPLLAVVAVVWAATTQLFAHNVVGLSAQHRARVSSPNPAPIVDVPVPFFDTGLSVACFLLTNQSTTDANITAFGLALLDPPPEDAGGFALVSPLDRGWTIREDLTVPGFPGVILDFAVTTGGNFTGGHRRLGIRPPGPGEPVIPTRVCVSGPFSADPIETLLNGVFVAFKGGAGKGNVLDIGIWERAQRP